MAGKVLAVEGRGPRADGEAGEEPRARGREHVAHGRRAEHERELRWRWRAGGGGRECGDESGERGDRAACTRAA